MNDIICGITQHIGGLNFTGSYKAFPDNPHIGQMIIMNGSMYVYSHDGWAIIDDDGNTTPMSNSYTKKIIAYKCKSCGASLNPTDTIGYFKCPYCRTTYMSKYDLDISVPISETT